MRSHNVVYDAKQQNNESALVTTHSHKRVTPPIKNEAFSPLLWKRYTKDLQEKFCAIARPNILVLWIKSAQGKLVIIGREEIDTINSKPTQTPRQTGFKLNRFLFLLILLV